METAETATTVAPPQVPAVRIPLTKQLHVLVDVPTYEYVIGRADEQACDRGYKTIRQGEVVRELLIASIARAAEADPDEYERLVLRGRQVLAE